jgi:hypothetical protein
VGDQKDNSLAAVVYGMVQVRKKTALGSSLSVPSKEKQTSTGTGRLSVTFSLRKKRRKPDHRLQRIASEKHGESKSEVIGRNVQSVSECPEKDQSSTDQVYSGGSQLVFPSSSTCHLQLLQNQSTCHSSPALNALSSPSPEPSPTSQIIRDNPDYRKEKEEANV